MNHTLSDVSLPERAEKHDKKALLAHQHQLLEALTVEEREFLQGSAVEYGIVARAFASFMDKYLHLGEGGPSDPSLDSVSEAGTLSFLH